MPSSNSVMKIETIFDVNESADDFNYSIAFSLLIFSHHFNLHKSKYIRFRLVNYRTVPDYLRIINNPSSVKFIQFRKLSTTFYESRELRNKHNGLHYYIFVSSIHYLLRNYPIYYCSETYIEGMPLSLVGSSLSRYMSVAKILD